MTGTGPRSLRFRYFNSERRVDLAITGPAVAEDWGLIGFVAGIEEGYLHGASLLRFWPASAWAVRGPAEFPSDRPRVGLGSLSRQRGAEALASLVLGVGSSRRVEVR